MSIWIPLRTSTPGNRRRHWRHDHREAKAQRTATYWVLKSVRDLPAFPVTVTIIRESPRPVDKTNLSGALKHVIDGIADYYGVDDSDDRWRFVLGQRRGGEHGVEITIEPATDGPAITFV